MFETLNNIHFLCILWKNSRMSTTATTNITNIYLAMLHVINHSKIMTVKLGMIPIIILEFKLPADVDHENISRYS